MVAPSRLLTTFRPRKWQERWLDAPVLNLGFSGNGNMEPEFVDLSCELDPAVYVLDCLPNMTAPLVAERAEPAVRKLRAGHGR